MTATAIAAATDVLIVESSGGGGDSHYAYLLCTALTESGLRPRLVTRAGWEMLDRPRAFPVELVLAARQPYRVSIARLVRLVRATRPAVVHVLRPISTRKDGVLFALLRALGPAVVYTAHNVVPHEADWLDRLGAWGLYHAADHVIVHNEATRAAVAARYRVGPRRLTVVPHGDYAFFAAGAPSRADARRRLGVPAGERRVLFFGAIREYKGLDVLLEAFAGLTAEHADCRLVVAGAPLRGTLEPYRRQAHALGVADHVSFSDRYLSVDEAACQLRAADVAAFPYRHVWESGSIRVAIALGCPVVTSDVGGLRDVIRDGVTGRLVPPGDPAALARAIAETLADPAAAAARAAEALVEERAKRGWPEVAAQTAAVYRRAMR